MLPMEVIIIIPSSKLILLSIIAGGMVLAVLNRRRDIFLPSTIIPIVAHRQGRSQQVSYVEFTALFTCAFRRARVNYTVLYYHSHPNPFSTSSVILVTVTHFSP